MKDSKIDPNLLAFFNDTDASSAVSLKHQQIGAPIVLGSAITPVERMGGGATRVIEFILDYSNSMEHVMNDVLDGFNQGFVPALKEASEDDVAVLRIGGLVFSDDVRQIWQVKKGAETISFHSLADLPPLTENEYDPRRGISTALHRAIPHGATLALVYAAAGRKATGSPHEVEVIVVSDGFNNLTPKDPDDVKKLIDGSKKDLVRFTWLFCGNDDPNDVKARALAMGFDMENVQMFAPKPGETQEERRSRFRRLMQVASKVSVSKGTSATKAHAALAAASGDVV